MFEDKELKDSVTLSGSGLYNNCSVELRGKDLTCNRTEKLIYYVCTEHQCYIVYLNIYLVLQPNERILVSELLEDIPDKYYEFAHLLGLNHTTVECFRIEYRDSPHRCLIAVLNHWVRNHAEDVSWTKVVDTLEKLPRKDVAKRIRSRYLCEESKASDSDHVAQSYDTTPTESPP